MKKGKEQKSNIKPTIQPIDSAKPAKVEAEIDSSAIQNPSPTHTDAPPMNTELLKKVFFGSLVLMLMILWISGYNVGYHQDEMDMNNYGQANYAYYLSGGKDSSYLVSHVKYHEVDSLLRFYGSAFEYLAVGATKLTGTVGGKQEFNVRHAVNQVFAVLALLFTGLIARKLMDWRASIFAIWLAFLSPSFFGHFLFNTKDIPFCAGYLATLYYIIHLLEELPTISWKTTLKLMVAFAFTTDIRIGGVLLIMYLFVFLAVYLFTTPNLLQASLKNIVDITLKLTVVIIGGMSIVVITWPFLLQSPIKNLIATLEVVKKFPLKININYEGISIDSLHVPPTYIPKFMSITAPIYAIAVILLGVGIYFLKFKKYPLKTGALLLFSIVFPVVYAVATHASLYSGWRHFLFIYPGLCIFASTALVDLFDNFKQRAFRIGFGLVSFLGMLPPIIWSVQNHPYEYTYFNEFAGGYKNAFYNYDNDYWEITVKKAVDWLMKNEPIAQSKDSVTISSNVSRFLDDYIVRHYPGTKARVVPTGVTGRNSIYWTYAVYNSLFLKPDYLENYFPPAQTVFAETIDGLPTTVIVKDTARLDFKGLEALKIAQHQLADSFYEAHIRNTKDNNAALYAYMAVVKSSLNKNDEAIALANKCLQYHFSTVLDYNAYCGLGIAYANKREYQMSIMNLDQATRLMPKENYSKDILVQVNQIMEREKAAGTLK